MHSNWKRIVCLVADGFGVGEAPDASAYGDGGSDTLGHVLRANSALRLPNLEKLGLGWLGQYSNLSRNHEPLALVGRLAEVSEGKDTTTGHWEMMGIETREPFQLFPNGFPDKLVTAWVQETNLSGILGNKAASGTEIIKELGLNSIQSGQPILYTSGDSVFQVAAHEEAFGLQRLYQICEKARELTVSYRIARVIARPFVGNSSDGFKRTENRRDYSLSPSLNAIDYLKQSGVPVYSVGKIEDIFAHRGFSCVQHTGNNADSLNATLDFMKKCRDKSAFVFTNLVDFDMLYGHRRDPIGYGCCLEELDTFLPKILAELTQDDLMILTSDHGCDPTFKGTDHTREFVPLLAYSPGLSGQALGDRASFSDIGASILSAFHVPNPLPGQSFLPLNPGSDAISEGRV